MSTQLETNANVIDPTGSPDKEDSAPQVHIIARSRALFRQVLWLSNDAFGGLALCHGEAPIAMANLRPEGSCDRSPHVSSITTGIRIGAERPRRIPWLCPGRTREHPRVVALPVPQDSTTECPKGPEQIETVNKLSLAVALTVRCREKTLVALRLEPEDRIVVQRPEAAAPWTTRLHPGGSRASAPHPAEPDVNIWLDL